jgi:hypothetical protein
MSTGEAGCCPQAGFGNTTLLTECAARCDRPVAWLSLHESDNDPTHFLVYLFAALQSIEAGIGKGALSAPDAAPPALTVVFGEARWRQEVFASRDLDRPVEQRQYWLLGSDAHCDMHYALYARHLAPGLRALGDGERNVHPFTPADVMGAVAG